MRIAAAAVLVAAVLAPAALAKGKIFVTLTKPVPAHAAHGQRIVVAFTARDAAGRKVISGPFYVKVICPTKDAFTRTLAYGPTNKKSFETIGKERATLLPTAPDNIKDMKLPSPQWWEENRQKVTERFNSWIIS